jgi:hypothetical protein
VSKRSRLLAGLAGAALLIGAVVVLRVPEPATEEAKPVVVERFAADLVVLPVPGTPPPQPERIVVHESATGLRVSWADGLSGVQTPPPAVAGYEVRWERLDGEGAAGSRLVVTPDVWLDGLVADERYRIQVRSVDAHGQRSAPTEATGELSPAPLPMLLGVTEVYDDFADPATVAPDSPGSRWHVSSHRGCAGVRAGRGLAIDLGCGSDMAVLRARSPLRLSPGAGDELGRVAVETDTAGPGGELTVDLVPGRADRVGVNVQRASRAEDRDPGLPGGTIRVSISDGGVQVSVAPDVPVRGPTVEYQQAPLRGPGVPHLFEVALTTSGVRVYQDGLAVALRAVTPKWRQASVLLGFRGPADRPARVHVSAAGFSGARGRVAGVVEAPLLPATSRILAPAEAGPTVGVSRAPLRQAKAAQIVATLAVNPELDLDQAVVQLGRLRIPAKPAVSVPPKARGAALTVVADVPPALLGPRGPAMITPFVIRAPGADTTATVLETYLEITPTPEWRGSPPPSPVPLDGLPDGVPSVELELANAAGEPLTSRTLPPHGQVVVDVRLDARTAQWDTGAVAGVAGVQVYLDETLIAGIPTDANGPAVGGTYALPIALGGLKPGNHTIEVHQYGAEGTPQTALRNFTVR